MLTKQINSKAETEIEFYQGELKETYLFWAFDKSRGESIRRPERARIKTMLDIAKKKYAIEEYDFYIHFAKHPFTEIAKDLEDLDKLYKKYSRKKRPPL